MNTPERSPAEERKTQLRIEFTDLMRRFILEGIVDPSNGTDFTLIQSEIGVPFEPIESIAERGKHVLTASVPDPIQQEFHYLTMSDEERLRFNERRSDFINNFKKYFGETDQDHEDDL